MATVEVSGLGKTFGTHRALEDLSFAVHAGEVFGLLGPNGAGKTTTLRILATLLKPSRGEARVAGFDVRRQAERVRAAIGVVNGGMGLYDRLTGREVLTYFGRLYGLSRAEVGARIDELDALLNLKGILERRTGDFSTGMKQKLIIARAVLHDPPVIFFDEATSGLDILARRSVLDFVKSYPKGARAVVYSTHVMSEVEELCDRVAILYEGRLIAQGTPQALTEAAGARGLEGAFFTLVERSAGFRAAPQGVRA
ncbi:ABC transporter ATP-binding protein [Truepera radiovictrix]|uniref:ABC transporter related protein n=1 Tax=Truepera radiovictrix (strain DSM 17093 / CIP 108686 / LMG 22925 / RQ-24) TaxID=649638 RepID=D7CSN2_TRURR|nr:ATP-binding cassette domain-containing protein [Truepera radiovictrix]ADI15452.1 ABC transporter related protein [Truepera radiovictrix DSM 17093]WMT55997.1 ATP-binding cassette domain-containing protein [Truepera radiovictrix]